MFLLIGFLTTYAATALALLEVLTVILRAPIPFGPAPAAAFVAAIATAVLLLGPGAFSVDARIFGLREIIIATARAHDAGKTGQRDRFPEFLATLPRLR